LRNVGQVENVWQIEFWEVSEVRAVKVVLCGVPLLLPVSEAGRSGLQSLIGGVVLATFDIFAFVSEKKYLCS
jgi:hypothetical protein